jgi:urease accessory protein
MDWLLLGRAAHGETLTAGAIRDDWRVHRGGRLAWADSFRLDGDIAAQTARASLLGGCTALATLLYIAADAADHLDRAREILGGLPVTAGATLVNGLLICRLAAPLAGDPRRAVSTFLRAFRAELGGFPPDLPRVWAC